MIDTSTRCTRVFFFSSSLQTETVDFWAGFWVENGEIQDFNVRETKVSCYFPERCRCSPQVGVFARQQIRHHSLLLPIMLKQKCECGDGLSGVFLPGEEEEEERSIEQRLALAPLLLIRGVNTSRHHQCRRFKASLAQKWEREEKMNRLKEKLIPLVTFQGGGGVVSVGGASDNHWTSFFLLIGDNYRF